MNTTANEHPSFIATAARNPLTYVAGLYCLAALGLFVYDFVTTYREIRFEARIHRLMTSSNSITVDHALSELSDVIVHQETIHEAQPLTNIVIDFGDPWVQSVGIAFDPQTRIVKFWGMSKGSDPVNTERAADGGALRYLIIKSGIAVAIVLSPLSLFWFQSRIRNSPLRIVVQGFAITAAILSVFTTLLEVLILSVRLL